MSIKNTSRYSDNDLEKFRAIIHQKIDKAQHDLELIKSAYMNDHNNGTEDTSPTFKAFDEGSQVMSKESNSQLAIRQEKFIRDEKSLFDDPNVIIVEEIDPTKDLFYSIVGQIENAIPA